VEAVAVYRGNLVARMISVLSFQLRDIYYARSGKSDAWRSTEDRHRMSALAYADGQKVVESKAFLLCYGAVDNPLNANMKYSR
jgi:hypothetical protein